MSCSPYMEVNKPYTLVMAKDDLPSSVFTNNRHRPYTIRTSVHLRERAGRPPFIISTVDSIPFSAAVTFKNISYRDVREEKRTNVRDSFSSPCHRCLVCKC